VAPAADRRVVERIVTAGPSLIAGAESEIDVALRGRARLDQLQ
jgi:hypothetical protein